MNETHDPEDESDQIFDRTVDDVAKAIKEREIPEYDGVQGEPPEWVPEWAVLYFEGYRDRLLSDRGFEVSALLKLIEQYRKEYFREEHIGSVSVPYFRCPKTYPNGQSVDSHCFHDEIGFLTWLKWCVDQGEEECLEILGGGFAVSGMKAVDSREKATNAKHARSRDSKKYCIHMAKIIWDDQAKEKDEKISRMGEMVERLLEFLKQVNYYRPKNKETVKEWLKEGEAEGELNIPPEARKPGAPKK